MFTTCRSGRWQADTGTSPTLAPSESSSWQAQIWTPFPRFLASWKINGRNHCELKFVRHRHGRSFHGFDLSTWHVRDVRALGLLQKTLTSRVRLSIRSAGLYVIAQKLADCSECSKQSVRVLQAHYHQVQAECLRRVPVPDPVTGRWKRPRPEHAEGTAQPVKDPSDEEDNFPQTSKRQATSAAGTLAKTSTSCGTLDELAERLGSFHESARALVHCLQKRDVPRTTDQSMTEAAKCMFHKLLEEVKDDLDRVTPQSHPCPRPEESSEISVHQMSTETALPRSSAGIPEQAVEDDPRKQLELSVPQYQPGEWKQTRIRSVHVRHDNIELAPRKGREEGQYSKFSDVHRTWIRWFKRRQAVH